jgi:deoxyribodipyrimidine photo-lyase
LKLPWQLGADFFLQNLLDGDAASNTLSWRWVAGLQTKGKTYLARTSNIEKFTDGRFKPDDGQLANDANALTEIHEMPKPIMPDLIYDLPKNGKIGLLITEEDARADEWLDGDFAVTAAINLSRFKSSIHVNPLIDQHVNAVLSNHDQINDIDQWKMDHELDHIVTAYCPVGHVRDALSERDDITYIAREYDATCWPFATKGFFKFKEKIPKLIDELNLG